eukprot:jgi/Chrzof1/8674/Cz03g20030.t1
MQASIVCGRSFTMEYAKEQYPEHMWKTPLVVNSTRAIAASWITNLLIMATAAVVAAILNVTDGGLSVLFNYILQLVPLLFAVAFTIVYPIMLKKRWGYIEGDISTAYPPSQRQNSLTLQLNTSNSPSSSFEAGSKSGQDPQGTSSHQYDRPSSGDVAPAAAAVC